MKEPKNRSKTIGTTDELDRVQDHDFADNMKKDRVL